MRSRRVERRRGNGIRIRNVSYEYFLPDEDGIEEKVCLEMFCAVFGVTKGRITWIQHKVGTGAVDLKDQRGAHENRPRNLPANVRMDIRAHIDSFPAYISHYKRAVSFILIECIILILLLMT
jgi:hypothetical protein